MEETVALEKIPQPEISQEELLRQAQEEQREALRRQANVQGGVLLIYRVIMNVALFAVIFAVSFAQAFRMSFEGGFYADFSAILNTVMDSMMDTMGWGHLAAVLIGWLILRLWKKKNFFKNEIYKPGKPMSIGGFMALTCLVMGCQLPAQLLTMGLEWVANLFGGSFVEILEQNAVDTDSLSLWLYVCLAAPITEEILFRGLVLRSLEPYGKKFAIIVSAVLFGLYHGNPIQTPYALLVGLILGYVAVEYNVIWAMVLHMINNLLLGDSLPRLLEGLPYNVADTVMWIVLIVFFLASLVVLLIKWRTVAEKSREETVEPWQKRAFWRSPCVVILCIMCLMDMGLILLMMFM